MISNDKYIPNELKIILTREEIERFSQLKIIISRLNILSNLTKLIDGYDYWISQVYDSVWPYFEEKGDDYDNKKFIDLGSGCGFPGLAYAITHPNSEIFLIDSSRKKTAALKKIVSEMDLKNNVFVINERIESFAHDTNYRHKFDIGTARALGSPEIVSEYIIPLLNENGRGILYCGKWNMDYHKKLEKSLEILNGSVKTIMNKILPAQKGERNVIFVNPDSKCANNYPRRIGKPSKYPLGS